MKNIQDHTKKISISADIPPIPRLLKDNRMLFLNKLAPDIKLKSGVRYLASWPFVELKIEGKSQNDTRNRYLE